VKCIRLMEEGGVILAWYKRDMVWPWHMKAMPLSQVDCLARWNRWQSLCLSMQGNPCEEVAWFPYARVRGCSQGADCLRSGRLVGTESFSFHRQCLSLILLGPSWIRSSLWWQASGITAATVQWMQPCSATL